MKTLDARIGPLLLVVLGIWGAVWFLGGGLDHLQSVDQLGRVVPSHIGTILPGPVVVKGKVIASDKTLKSPYSNSDSVYYRYQRELRQEDTEWHVVEVKEDAVDFVLEDPTGSVIVPAQSAKKSIRWAVMQSSSTTEDNIRHSEWRIDLGQSVSIMATGALRDGEPSLHFTSAGLYPPLIANQPTTVPLKASAKGLLSLWAGLACAAAAVMGTVIVLKVHRVLSYLSLLTLVLIVVLLHSGLTMFKRDISAALATHQRLTDATTEAAQRLVNHKGLPWPGWVGAAAMLNDPPPRLDEVSQRRLRAYLLQLEGNRLRVLEKMRGVPERLLMVFWGLDEPAPVVAMDLVDEPKLPSLSAVPSPHINEPGLVVVMICSALLACGATIYGFYAIRLKRLIENISTTPTRGVTCGYAEVSGRVAVPEWLEVLTSPLTFAPCAWYEYEVQEEEDTPDNRSRSWKTIERKFSQQALLCRDAVGELLVDPAGAEVICSHETTECRDGLRYHEKYLGLEEDFYGLGSAVVDPAQPDRLVLCKGADREPFIMSNYPEDKVLLKKARTGIAGFNFAVVAYLMSVLLLFAQDGSLVSSDFFFAAISAPLYLTALMLVLHYNDLIFLHRRALRNWANIEVALTKRKTVLEAVEPVLKRTLQHERQIQQALATMRAQLRTAHPTPDQTASFMQQEARLARSLKVAIEQYPQLKSDALVLQFMATLATLETEIALLREGYNDSVTYYNTRIRIIPDVFLALAFNFKPLQRLHFVA